MTVAYRMPEIPPMVECAECKEWYHTECVTVPMEALENSSGVAQCSTKARAPATFKDHHRRRGIHFSTFKENWRTPVLNGNVLGAHRSNLYLRLYSFDIQW